MTEQSTCELCGAEDHRDDMQRCAGCGKLCCPDCIDWCAPDYDPPNGDYFCEDCQVTTGETGED